MVPTWNVSLKSFLTILLLTQSFTNAALHQTPQVPGLKFSLDGVPTPNNTMERLAAVPSICAKYTGRGKECAATMVATNVTFQDCGSPFTVCRCSNANITLDEAVHSLANVPIGLRRHAATIMVMPDKSAHAYTLGTDIHFFGVCSQRSWLHEVRLELSGPSSPAYSCFLFSFCNRQHMLQIVHSTSAQA